MTPTLEQIWHDFSGQLGQFIRARVADPAAAEDIRQDIFVKIQARLGQLKDPAKLSAWIYLIARNAVIDHYRARKETVEVPETLTDETQPESGGIRDLRRAFLRMIHSLPEPYREALLLTELEGMTQQEFAMKAGITLSGAKSRVQRARRQLKTMLTECCAFEFDRRGGVIECTPRAQANCAECR